MNRCSMAALGVACLALACLVRAAVPIEVKIDHAVGGDQKKAVTISGSTEDPAILAVDGAAGLSIRFRGGDGLRVSAGGSDVTFEAWAPIPAKTLFEVAPYGDAEIEDGTLLYLDTYAAEASVEPEPQAVESALETILFVWRPAAAAGPPGLVQADGPSSEWIVVALVVMLVSAVVGPLVWGRFQKRGPAVAAEVPRENIRDVLEPQLSEIRRRLADLAESDRALREAVAGRLDSIHEALRTSRAAEPAPVVTQHTEPRSAPSPEQQHISEEFLSFGQAVAGYDNVARRFDEGLEEFFRKAGVDQDALSRLTAFRERLANALAEAHKALSKYEDGSVAAPGTARMSRLEQIGRELASFRTAAERRVLELHFVAEFSLQEGSQQRLAHAIAGGVENLARRLDNLEQSYCRELESIAEGEALALSDRADGVIDPRRRDANLQNAIRSLAQLAGLEPLDVALNSDFVPALHVRESETPGQPARAIAGVVRRGFIRGGAVVRKAHVRTYR